MSGFRVIERRDVVPKRRDRYASFPGLVRTGPGRILMGFRYGRSRPNTFSHGAEGDFMLVRCEGGHWGRPQLLYAHRGPIEDMSCGDLTRLRDGTILLFTREYDGSRSRTHATYVSRSTDGGATFQPRKAILPACFHEWWVPYGKVIEPADGVLLMGGYGRRAEGDGISAACLESRDRGESWSLRGWIGAYGCLGKLPLDEPFMLLLPDGRLHAMLRTNGTFYTTASDDGGRTWRPPREAFHGNACAGTVLSSGEMLISYRGTGHEVHVPGQRVATVKERKGRLYCFRTSADGGATWSEEGILDDGTAWQVGSYGMGDVLELEDGRVLAVYYTSDPDQAPWIQQAILGRE